MTAPNPDTTRGVDPLRKRRKRIRNDVIACVLAILMLTFAVLNNVHDAQSHWKSANVIQDEIQEMTMESVAMDRMLKSCLPTQNTKCNEYIPEKTKVQRVAIISPPGLFATLLERMVDFALEDVAAKDEFEFIHTSHVPPYGYGKTHGLTKIIRLVPQPLVLGVTDMLVNGQGDTTSVVDDHQLSPTDIYISFRQLVRFHCRLSHVSAHTALLTISFKDVIRNPDQVVEQIRLFLGHKANQQQQQLLRLRTALEVSQRRKSLKDKLSTTIQSIRSSAVTVLSQFYLKEPVMTMLGDELRGELEMTHNLTDWPCQSFWSAGDRMDPYSLTVVSQHIAASLSPNCTATFSNCWVPRDVCEANGDGHCKGH